MVLSTGQFVSGIAQASRLVPGAQTVGGAEFVVAALRQLFCACEIAAQALVAKHQYLAFTGLKAAEALLRQQLAVHMPGLMAWLWRVARRIVTGLIYPRLMGARGLINRRRLML